MPEASTLQFLFQLAKGIASHFGPNCEVVVHDLDSNDPESSIVAIENGQSPAARWGTALHTWCWRPCGATGRSSRTTCVI